MITRYPKPPILADISHTRHGVIEASAGTGKTYTIEHLVIDLLLQTDANLEQILVVTFTEKATIELRRRIRALVEKVLQDSTPIESESTVAELQSTDPGAWYLDTTRRRKLEAELFAFDRAPIFTIHGFCNRVLRELAFSSGQMLNPSNVDADKLFAEVWRDALRSHFAVEEPYLAALQRWLSRHRTEDDLRRLLRDAHRQGYLEHRIDLNEDMEQCAGLLLAHFDPEAYVADLARLAVRRGAIGTASEAADALVECLRSARAGSDVFKALNPAWLQALATPEVVGSREPNLRFPDGLNASHRRCRTTLLKMHRLTLLHSSEERAYVELFLPLIQELLDDRKDREGLFEYDDLLTRVHAAMDGAAGSAIQETLQSRFRFGLIDEFQDTDGRQWDIFRQIFVESEHGTLFVIGDPKQAIYGFRGADVQTYLNARRTLLEDTDPPAQYLSLRDNFRSTDMLIDGVNLILDSSGEHALLQGEIRYDTPVRCGRPECTLIDADGRTVPPITLWTHTPPRRSGRRPLSGWALMDVYLNALKTTLSTLFQPTQGYRVKDTPDAPGRPLSARDVFVLVRSRREAQLVAQALNDVGITCVRQQDSNPLRSAEAQAIHDVLKAIASPLDDTARLWAFATPFFGLSWEELSQIKRSDSDAQRTDRLRAWREWTDRSDYGALFRALRYDSGLIARARFAVDGAEQTARFDQLFEWLLELVAGRKVRLNWLVDLLSRLLAGEVIEGLPEIGPFRLADSDDAVQVMTMHKSKGLQAPIVCLFGGFLKPWNSAVNVVNSAGKRHVIVGEHARTAFEKEIEAQTSAEDERLLYVALTRAGSKLFLPYIDSEQTIGGPYRRLNARLHAMVQSGLPTELFSLSAAESRGRHIPGPTAPHQPTEIDQTRPRLEPTASPADRLHYAQLKQTHGPWVVTSYSSMKSQGEAAVDPESIKEEGTVDQRQQPDAETTRVALPGGRFMGRFLHEAIEALDFDQVLDLEEDIWCEYPTVVDAFEQTMRRHNIEPRWMRDAQTLIYQTLSRPLHLPNGTELPPLASVRGHREMEFIFPMPEVGQPLLAELNPDESRCVIDRGLIKGFIDFTFVHQGQLYWLDWKSDVMSAYDPATLEAHVARHYDLQAWLYTLSTVRLLGIRDAASYEARFGGYLYVFLRGLTPEAAQKDGYTFGRPSWGELCQFEHSLISDSRLPTRRQA